MGRCRRGPGCRHPWDRALPGRIHQAGQAARVGELTFLRRWKEEILTKIQGDGSSTAEATATPKAADRSAELRTQIELAIVEERYEDAALLRDELKRLNSEPSPEAGPESS